MKLYAHLQSTFCTIVCIFILLSHLSEYEKKYIVSFRNVKNKIYSTLLYKTSEMSSSTWFNEDIHRKNTSKLPGIYSLAVAPSLDETAAPIRDTYLKTVTDARLSQQIRFSICDVASLGQLSCVITRRDAGQEIRDTVVMCVCRLHAKR